MSTEAGATTSTEVGGRWKLRFHTQPETPDLRCAVLGPKGYKERTKRKRAAEAELEVIEPAAGDMELDEAENASKRLKNSNSTFIPVSGRVWKAEAKPAGRVMKPRPSNSSWEKKMAEKAVRANFLVHKREALDDQKRVRQAKTTERKNARERKKANTEKSQIVQKVSTATVKKMMKNRKQKKLLKKADTN